MRTHTNIDFTDIVRKVKQDTQSFVAYSDLYFAGEKDKIQDKFLKESSPTIFSLMVYIVTLCNLDLDNTVLEVIEKHIDDEGVAHKELLAYLASLIATGKTAEQFLEKAQTIGEAHSNIINAFNLYDYPKPSLSVAAETFLCLLTLSLVERLNGFLFHIYPNMKKLNKIAKKWLESPSNQDWIFAKKIAGQMRFDDLITLTKEIDPEYLINNFSADNAQRLLESSKKLRQKAFTILSTAAEQDDNPAVQYQLANYYIDEGNWNSAFLSLSSSAGNKFPPAQVLMGKLIIHTHLPMFNDLLDSNELLQKWLSNAFCREMFLNHHLEEAIELLKSAQSDIPEVKEYLLNLQTTILHCATAFKKLGGRIIHNPMEAEKDFANLPPANSPAIQRYQKPEKLKLGSGIYANEADEEMLIEKSELGGNVSNRL